MSDLGAWGDDGGKAAASGEQLDKYTALSKEVTARIYQLSSNVNTLKRMLSTLGTPSDTQSLRRQMCDNERESSVLSRDIMGMLRRLSQLHTHGDASLQRARQTQTDKLSRDFKTVLIKAEQTNKAFKEQSRKTVMHVPDTFPGGNDEDDDTVGLLDLAGPVQREVHAQEYADNERLITDREQGIQQIEQSVVEVNEIFRDLNSLVVAQGDMVDTIEANIESAADRVERGTTDLVSARNSQKKAQSKTIVIAGVLVVVLIVLILIIYFTTRHKKGK